MAKDKICGIYKITAKHNGKIYIGQSKDIHNRWIGHWKQVARGDSDYLHNSMRKYGKENFEYEIIEECGQDIINEREIYWIEYFNSYNNGYNLTLGGEGVKGKQYSFDAKENMRNYAKEHNISKPILQIDIHGNIIKEWRSCKEIGKLTNMLSTNIHDCVKHKDGYRLAYGYIWIYKDEYLTKGLDIDLYLSINKDIAYSKIYQIDKNNVIVKIWNNINEIIDENPNYCKSSIYSVCNKCAKTVYKYVWVYEKDYDINCDYSKNFNRNKTTKKVYQFTLEGILINVYTSLVNAENATGINKTVIGQCARHVLKTTGVFIWLFESEKDNIMTFSNAIKK